jgi:hypothetical protein
MNPINYLFVDEFPLLTSDKSVCYVKDNNYIIEFHKKGQLNYYANMRIKTIVHPLQQQIFAIVSKILDHRIQLGMISDFVFCIGIYCGLPYQTIVSALSEIVEGLMSAYPTLKICTYANKFIIAPI